MKEQQEHRTEGHTSPLFETKKAAGYAYRIAYRLFALTILLGICLIWIYRIKNLPGIGQPGRLAWIGMFVAELMFGLYWILTESFRWKIVHHHPFKDRLLNRYGDKLPGADIFVCTADPAMEPPVLVINTILSVMSYNYPTEKLSIYLADDGGSELTFYAILEATNFSKYWIPFSKKFNVEPRSPEAYFAQNSRPEDIFYVQEWLSVKKLYEDMTARIESVCEKGSVPEVTRTQHKGFSEWNSKFRKQDHQSIVQIIIDGRNKDAIDNDGYRLPTLVYIAREKRPYCPHNFKAGSMNALIRVSSEISNGPIILNLDCDMYANDPDAILEGLCFFMDEEKGHEVGYLQHPQKYNNISRNDIYSNYYSVTNKVELPGIGSYGSAMYCGTGCFHRRESISGRLHSKNYKGQLFSKAERKVVERTIDELEKSTVHLANCSYEKGTRWGKEMGLIYGIPVEDVVTGLKIQCRGWKSLFYNPERAAFLGVAPITLDLALVQHKRWSEGMFQIFFSKYCPFLYGHNKITLGAQMAYCPYLLWAPISLPTIYYVTIPSLCLLHGISLFPKVSTVWFLPFAYVGIGYNAYILAEALILGSTLKAWWNCQRMWMIRRTTSYFFAFIDTMIRQFGFFQPAFAVTAKVVAEDTEKRYKQEVMEFGSSSIMFITLATFAMLNLFCLVGGTKAVLLNFKELIPQYIICGILVMVNTPVYQALFIRRDKGSMPSPVMIISTLIATLACLLSMR